MYQSANALVAPRASVMKACRCPNGDRKSCLCCLSPSPHPPSPQVLSVQQPVTAPASRLFFVSRGCDLVAARSPRDPNFYFIQMTLRGGFEIGYRFREIDLKMLGEVIRINTWLQGWFRKQSTLFWNVTYLVFIWSRIVIVLLQTKRKIYPINYHNREAYSQVFLDLKVLSAVAAQCYRTVDLQPWGWRQLHGRHLYSLPQVHREVSSHQKCSKGNESSTGERSEKCELKRIESNKKCMTFQDISWFHLVLNSVNCVWN